jgi:tRNA pseudouridine32 synthase/23S rRNA pseudouridine746 synthase
VIVYEDDDLVVIEKPAGLLSVPGRLPEHQDSAYLRVLAQFPQAKITHRLDMATSGILMFAKHRDAEVAVSKMFQARTVEKHYIALVQGQLDAEGSVEVPLITDWENRPRQIVHFELGKPAKTLYQALSYDIETDITRVLLTPITGRSQQLRVHMQYIGHPITGDKLYHPEPTRSPLKRMALHASFLAFQQPLSGQSVAIHGRVPF